MIIEDMSLFEFEETRKEYLNKGTVLTDIDEKSENDGYSNGNSFMSNSSGE